MLLILTFAGLVSGILAGFLGIGGGIVLVPILVALGNTPVQSVATSSLAILITAVSGSIQNWRMGNLDFRRVFDLGLPALITAQIGVFFAKKLPPNILLILFGILLIANVYLVDLRKKITVTKLSQPQDKEIQKQIFNPIFARIITGSTAGILAGLFGVGGGVIMVPLQIIWLGESIKLAIQTSLGVIVITAISACVGHALNNNVLCLPGIVLGLGGLVGVQISTRLLPKLPDPIITFAFRAMLAMLSVYIFWQAWHQH